MANKAVKSPIITVDGKELLWLQREAGGPHASTMLLVKTCLPINSMVCIICLKYYILVMIYNT